jgi:hypothetical protein
MAGRPRGALSTGFLPGRRCAPGFALSAAGRWMTPMDGGLSSPFPLGRGLTCPRDRPCAVESGWTFGGSAVGGERVGHGRTGWPVGHRTCPGDPAATWSRRRREPRTEDSDPVAALDYDVGRPMPTDAKGCPGVAADRNRPKACASRREARRPASTLLLDHRPATRRAGPASRGRPGRPPDAPRRQARAPGPGVAPARPIG